MHYLLHGWQLDMQVFHIFHYLSSMNFVQFYATLRKEKISELWYHQCDN